jgi:hypothetical protein
MVNPTTLASSSSASIPTQVSIPQFVEYVAPNPYYIHPSDCPSLVLVTPPLDTNNYQTWSRSMRIAFSCKHKEQFINASVPIPTSDDRMYEPWRQCNNLVMAWLMRSCTSEIVKLVVYNKTAVDMWKELNERFNQGDMLRLSDPIEEIHNLRQDSASVT